LEKRGLNGRLILIDGAPEQMKTISKKFSSSTEEALQNDVLLLIMDVIQSTSSEKVDFIILVAKILFDLDLLVVNIPLIFFYSLKYF